MQALIGSGYAALGQGDAAGARRDFDEALDMSLAVGQRQQLVNALDGLVLAAAAEGRYERVLELVAASDAVRTASGDPAIGDGCAAGGFRGARERWCRARGSPGDSTARP